MRASAPRTLAVLGALGLALTACSSDRPVSRAAEAPASEVVEPSASASATSEPTPVVTATATATAAAKPKPTRPVEVVNPQDPLTPRPGIERAPSLGKPQCKAADLTMVDADERVSLEFRHTVFVVRTRGGDCQMQGYPAVQLYAADGSKLPVTIGRNGFGLHDDGPEAVTLSRATSVSFRLASGRDGSCTEAARIVATLPGTGGTLSAPTTASVCAGKAGVTPVQRLGDDHGDSG